MTAARLAGAARDPRARRWIYDTYEELRTQESGDWARSDGTQVFNRTASSVSFIYGSCVALGDQGCAPPLEIQIWSACVRNPSLYEGQSYGPVREKTTVLGVPAAFFEGGQRLEIQTETSTVVIFGHDQTEVTKVANALHGVNAPVQATDQLPSPPPSALDGRLACDK